VEFSDADYYELLGTIDAIDHRLARATGFAQAYSTYGRRIDVILDEWGTWFKQATVETGLYQQNTMQDALFTAAAFHCFHRHGERLWMTNMAQTVNVLQALVLTRGPQMLTTPTYHVYEMFKPHRDGSLVACDITHNAVIKIPDGDVQNAISVSPTASPDGAELTISVLNLDLSSPLSVGMNISGADNWKVSHVRRLATGDIRSHNTFEEPNTVRPEEVPVADYGDLSKLLLPPQSITTIDLKRENPKE
jgi:alpha-N-arabinofuranosidase